MSVGRFLHRRLLLLLIGAYLLAYFFPSPGVYFRSLKLGGMSGSGGLLAIMLFVAGFGIQSSNFSSLARRTKGIAIGVIVNALFPLFVLSILSGMADFWHNANEIKTILLGLSIVAVMPIAGSSVAWAQNSDGDMIVSVGLVLASAVFSPLVTPFGIHVLRFVLFPLRSLKLSISLSGTLSFLVTSLLIPGIAGLYVRKKVMESTARLSLPFLKILSILALLILNYSNGAVALPLAFRHPDWDFLFLTLIVAFVLCICDFTAGWFVGRISNLGRDQAHSMIFGLGMNNNGAGLAFASTQLAHFPMVVLPIIIFNFGQQVTAGLVTWLLRKRSSGTGQISS